MNALIIREVLREVHRHFVWTADDVLYGVPEHWTSHADVVERGEVFRDDCDGFALTCAELLLRRGLLPENVRIGACWTETGEYHLVCVAHGVLLDNRHRTTHPWGAVGYRWDKAARLSERTKTGRLIWRDAT
jgi:predicted transglutaminase-like cysteine proteinase